MQIFTSGIPGKIQPKVIIWSKTQLIKWHDFKKKPNPEYGESACSAIGFQSTPLIEHLQTKNHFKFKIKDMRLQAVFIPEFSWVMKNISKKDLILLLNHEQGHFDLAEEIIRKSRIKLIKNFQNRIFIIKEKKKNKSKKAFLFQIYKIRKVIEDKLQKDFKKQERKYDDKTNHGLIIKYQQNYNKRFKNLRR